MPRIKIGGPTAYLVRLQISEEDIRAVEESIRSQGRNYAWDVITGIATDDLVAAIRGIEDKRILRVGGGDMTVAVEVSESTERQAIRTVEKLLRKAGLSIQEWPAQDARDGEEVG